MYNGGGNYFGGVKVKVGTDTAESTNVMMMCKVIYFKFHENRSRGLRAVEGRKSPSPIDKAHGLYNSLYYRTSRDLPCVKCSMLLTSDVVVIAVRPLFLFKCLHNVSSAIETLELSLYRFASHLQGGPKNGHPVLFLV